MQEPSRRVLGNFIAALRKSSGDLHSSWGTGRLRLLFLVPLAFAIASIVLTLAIALYLHEHNSVENDVIRVHASARKFYQDSVEYDAKALRAVMDAISRDERLRAALKRQDRDALLDRAGPLFDELKRDYNITHFYFTRPDKVNLPRVHAPARYGDFIGRVTTREAEETGYTVHGVELGPLGTFTLRLVSPWYDNVTQDLLGYVEIGMEVDRAMQKLRDFFGVEVTVLIRKEFLDQRQWEAGTHILGRTPNWEQFPDVVVGAQASDVVPEILAERLAHGEQVGENVVLQLITGDRPYRMTFLTLQDAAARNVAEIVLLADITLELQSARGAVYAGSATALGVGAALFGFFFWLVGRIGHRIERDEMRLEQLATRDGLTGLHNHRTFVAMLDDELMRSSRHGQALSLLMIDIDHFKHVNDTYGHQAGDLILRGIGKRLERRARTIDRVCRYGGEEFAIILPNTNAEKAKDIAERIRNQVATRAFSCGGRRQISITISIGVATSSLEIDTSSALVGAADRALYGSKKNGRNRVSEAARGLAEIAQSE